MKNTRKRLFGSHCKRTAIKISEGYVYRRQTHPSGAMNHVSDVGQEALATFFQLKSDHLEFCSETFQILLLTECG